MPSRKMSTSEEKVSEPKPSFKWTSANNKIVVIGTTATKVIHPNPSGDWINIVKKSKQIGGVPKAAETHLTQPTKSSASANTEHPRENCLMVFRISESIEELAEKLHDDDIASLKIMVNKLFDATDAGITVIRAIRIGMRVKDPENPRLLKVVLRNP